MSIGMGGFCYGNTGRVQFGERKKNPFVPQPPLGKVVETRFDPKVEAEKHRRGAWEALKISILSLIAMGTGMHQFPQHFDTIRNVGVLASGASLFSAIRNDMRYRWLKLAHHEALPRYWEKLKAFLKQQMK